MRLWEVEADGDGRHEDLHAKARRREEEGEIDEGAARSRDLWRVAVEVSFWPSAQGKEIFVASRSSHLKRSSVCWRLG